MLWKHSEIRSNLSKMRFTVEEAEGDSDDPDYVKPNIEDMRSLLASTILDKYRKLSELSFQTMHSRYENPDQLEKHFNQSFMYSSECSTGFEVFLPDPLLLQQRGNQQRKHQQNTQQFCLSEENLSSLSPSATSSAVLSESLSSSSNCCSSPTASVRLSPASSPASHSRDAQQHCPFRLDELERFPTSTVAVAIPAQRKAGVEAPGDSGASYDDDSGEGRDRLPVVPVPVFQSVFSTLPSAMSPFNSENFSGNVVHACICQNSRV